MNNRNIRKQVEWLIRTNTDRKKKIKEAKAKRDEIADRIASVKFENVLQKHTTFADPTAALAAEIEELDYFIETNQKIDDAIEAAFADVGAGYPAEIRRDIRNAFRLNLQDGRTYSWGNLKYPFSSKVYKRHRRQMIDRIGKDLGLMHDDL
jgi:hypothetical protein